MAVSASYVVDFLSSSEGIQLNKAFVRIKDAKLRRKMIDLVRAMAGLTTKRSEATFFALGRNIVSS